MGPADLESILRELRSVRAELAALRGEVGAVRALLDQPEQPTLPFPPDPLEQLVTLDQAAALVHRSKRTLDGYRARGLPVPRVRGRRGQPHLWVWGDIRPWLEATFGPRLPETFPSNGG